MKISDTIQNCIIILIWLSNYCIEYVEADEIIFDEIQQVQRLLERGTKETLPFKFRIDLGQIKPKRFQFQIKKPSFMPNSQDVGKEFIFNEEGKLMETDRFLFAFGSRKNAMRSISGRDASLFEVLSF